MYTSIWRSIGINGSESGHLHLKDARLIYTPNDETKAGFDVSLSEIQELSFPWHYFGGGFKVRIGTEQYRFSFIEPHNEHADIVGGSETGKAWNTALKSEK